jgi:hypothetical protein
MLLLPYFFTSKYIKDKREAGKLDNLLKYTAKESGVPQSHSKTMLSTLVTLNQARDELSSYINFILLLIH